MRDSDDRDDHDARMASNRRDDAAAPLRGAAGGSVLSAELLFAHGYLEHK